jgi:hypothetical protein
MSLANSINKENKQNITLAKILHNNQNMIIKIKKNILSNQNIKKIINNININKIIIQFLN